MARYLLFIYAKIILQGGMKMNEEAKTMQEEAKNVNEQSETKELKMKASVMARPRTAKEIIIFILMILTILSVIVPFVNVLNVPTLIFGMPVGMPVLMCWAIMIIPITTIILIRGYKWGVH